MAVAPGIGLPVGFISFTDHTTSISGNTSISSVDHYADSKNRDVLSLYFFVQWILSSYINHDPPISVINRKLSLNVH